jgi:quercetin dioxygenase-like cupin family protein
MKRRNFLTTAVAVGTVLKTEAMNQVISTDSQQPFIVKSGQARNNGTGPLAYLKVSSKDTNGEFSLFELQNEAGPMAGPPLHVHQNQDEVFMILEGEFVFQVGDQKIKASAGDVVFGPRKIPHTYYQVSKKAHIIFSYNPAGKMENILVDAANKYIPNNLEAFAKASAENDVPFVGPPMTKPD